MSSGLSTFFHSCMHYPNSTSQPNSPIWLLVAAMGCWEVVGGGDKGGILVRAGQGTSSVSWICRVFFSKFLDSFGIGGVSLRILPWYSSPLLTTWGICLLFSNHQTSKSKNLDGFGAFVGVFLGAWDLVFSGGSS